MNIFYLHSNPKICAEYHADKHVVKMTTEMTQMLSTNLFLLTGIESKWKPTHQNHPCTKWMRRSVANLDYGIALTEELFNEYERRYKPKRQHASYSVFQSIKKQRRKMIAKMKFKKLTKPFQAMPDELRSSTAEEAYRKYYVEEKDHILEWKKGVAPLWLEEYQTKNLIIKDETRNV